MVTSTTTTTATSGGSDPLIVVEAAGAIASAKRVSPPRRGLRQFLSRRWSSSQQSNNDMKKKKKNKTTTRSTRTISQKDKVTPRQVDEVTKDDKVSEPREEPETPPPAAAESVPSVGLTIQRESSESMPDLHAKPPLKVEIDTRYVPIEDEPRLPTAEDDDTNAAVADTPCSLDQIFLHMAVLQRGVTSSTLRMMQSHGLLDHRHQDDVEGLKRDLDGEEKREDGLSAEEMAAVERAKKDLLLFQPEDVPTLWNDISKSFSMDEACNSDDTKQREDKEATPETADGSVPVESTADPENENTEENVNQNGEGSTDITPKKDDTTVAPTTLDQATVASFLCNLDDAILKSLSGSFSLDDVCSSDGNGGGAKTRSHEEPPTVSAFPDVNAKSFEEYYDDANSDFASPLLLKSPDRDMDVFSVDSAAEGRARAEEGESDHGGGLEVAVTRPEF